MKTVLCLLAVATAHAAGQISVPSPVPSSGLGTRPILGRGSTGNPGMAVAVPPRETSVTLVRHLTLDPPRQWHSTEGRTLTGSVIAFEDDVVKLKAPTPAAAMAEARKAPAPRLPDRVTVIRDGKMRLLINQKAVEVRLDRLREEDRAYIERLRDRFANRPIAPPP